MAELRQYDVTLQRESGDEVRLIWDGQNEVVPVALFFAPDVRDDMLLNSLRCFCTIENKPDPTAQSVLDGIRMRGGIHTPARPVYVQSITQQEDGTYTMIYGVTAADASYGLNFTREDIDRQIQSATLLAYQIGAFLRFAGFNELSDEAITAIQSRKFRGF